MTIRNPSLNYTINPNFRSNNPVVTSPPTLNPHRPVVTTLPSVSPLLSQINPEAQPRIDAYRRAAIEAYQSSAEIGKKTESIRHLIYDLDNLNIDNKIFVESLKQHIGMGFFKKVCEEIAFGIAGNRSAQTGEELLKRNFRDILRIKDYNGRSLLHQIEAYYSYQQENYRGIGELNSLGEILEKRADLTQKIDRLPGLLITKWIEEAAKLKLQAIKALESLPGSAKGAVCTKIYELDGAGQRENDYGYKTALEGIQKLLLHKGACPIKDGIAACSQNATKAPTLTTTYLHAESIQPSDSKATMLEIKKLYELADLKHFLNDPFKYNDFLVAKYLRLSPDVKKLIDESIWLACHKPSELGFSENLVSRNVKILRKVKNQKNEDIISQLIVHQQEKIKGQRRLSEAESFITATTGKTPHPHQLLNLFNDLSDKAKEDLRTRVWKRDGGEHNPEVCGYKDFFGNGKWGLYGTRKIEHDPHTLFLGSPFPVLLAYFNDLKEKLNKADSELLQALEAAKALPWDPIDASTSKLEREQDLIRYLPPHLKVAYVTPELKGGPSIGGLGPALDGIIQAFGVDDARVVMPLYRKASQDPNASGPIPNNIFQSLRPKQKYEVEVDGITHRVYKTKVNGIKCYFIDDPELLWIPPKEDGCSGNFYEGNDLYVRRRWIVFQSAAAELVYKFSKKNNNPVQLVHAHDAQTGLIPKFLAARHPEEWERGETPATMFTFHNNQEPMVYNTEETMQVLEQHGLPKIGVNSLMEALKDADMVTTVSENYGKEAQTGTFGNGMQDAVKKAALENKFAAFPNGNNNDWNPTKNEQLRFWKPVLDVNRTQPTIDLRFGPNSPDLADKIKMNQQEFCAYLKGLPYDDPAYADLDPEKPIATYLGRYDWSQKGIDKLFMIMEETLKNGCQFICIGTEPGHHDARKALERMKQYAKDLGKKGVLILEDRKDKEGKYKYQGVFGSLLRAATSMPIFPSKYEPCGLVQGEFNRFGKKVIATRTGGFIDTLKTEGPDANAYLFKRCSDWESAEQDREIIETLKVALADAQAMQQALYHGDASAQKPYIDSMRAIMRNALRSTWEQTPDGSLSPILRLYLVMAKAFKRRTERSHIDIGDLKTLKV